MTFARHYKHGKLAKPQYVSSNKMAYHTIRSFKKGVRCGYSSVQSSSSTFSWYMFCTHVHCMMSCLSAFSMCVNSHAYFNSTSEMYQEDWEIGAKNEKGGWCDLLAHGYMFFSRVTFHCTHGLSLTTVSISWDLPTDLQWSLAVMITVQHAHSVSGPATWQPVNEDGRLNPAYSMKLVKTVT